MKLKRYNIKAIYGNAAIRRKLIAYSTMITMAREDVDITYEESLRSYDMVVGQYKKQNS